jgi:hypothetical protein
VFLEENLKDFSFPIVLKEVYGSGSRGVYLVNNFYELENKIKKQEVHMGVRFFIFVKEFFLSFFPFFRNKEKEAYFKDYYNYVVQEYVPDLAFDYKVLVFFDKYYVLKRFIRTNDFRASGSGNFEFSEVEDSLLDYVLSVFEKLNEPFMSFDVCFDGRDYCLIELQGIHFGPYTQLNSSGYYTKKKNRWEFVDDKTSFECDIAYALYSYIKEGGLIG